MSIAIAAIAAAAVARRAAHRLRRRLPPLALLRPRRALAAPPPARATLTLAIQERRKLLVRQLRLDPEPGILPPILAPTLTLLLPAIPGGPPRTGSRPQPLLDRHPRLPVRPPSLAAPLYPPSPPARRLRAVPGVSPPGAPAPHARRHPQPATRPATKERPEPRGRATRV